MKFRFTKRARISSSMFAGCAFIALAVYGWGLPISTVLLFLAICLASLAAIVVLAAAAGWLLSALRRRNEPEHYAGEETD